MDVAALFSTDWPGQGWLQIYELLLAFALSSLVGLEREIKLKSAGLRTHALVGLGSCLFTLVSKYGFFDVFALGGLSLDPSRVASTVVTGIGFIGAGLIFVRKDIVHGLTTAATIWLVAGIGMACAGGLFLLAFVATAGHFITMIAYTAVMSRILGISSRLFIRYRLGGDSAEKILALCTAYGLALRTFVMKTDPATPESAEMIVRVQSRKSVAALSEQLLSLPEVISVRTENTDE